MLLADKTAIIYGGAGAIGSAVARAYAREGAEVHLAGRTEASPAEAAEGIQRDGGAAHVAPLDVLDQAAVQQHADAVAPTAASTSASTPRRTTTSREPRSPICRSTSSCAP